MMKTFLLLFMAMTIAGCATVKGVTVSERRTYILDMQKDTLEELYISEPQAKSEVKKAAGYGVFSSINTNLFLLSTSNGFGVVVNNKTKQKTYMKMASAGGGLGLGIKDFRIVMIFRNRDDLEWFIEKGWEFGGQLDAALKSEDKGGAGSIAGHVDLDIITYQFTRSGIALQATLQGTKYWKNKDLNG